MSSVGKFGSWPDLTRGCLGSNTFWREFRRGIFGPEIKFLPEIILPSYSSGSRIFTGAWKIRPLFLSSFWCSMLFSSLSWLRWLDIEFFSYRRTVRFRRVASHVCAWSGAIQIWSAFFPFTAFPPLFRAFFGRVWDFFMECWGHFLPYLAGMHNRALLTLDALRNIGLKIDPNLLVFDP